MRRLLRQQEEQLMAVIVSRLETLYDALDELAQTAYDRYYFAEDEVFKYSEAGQKMKTEGESFHEGNACIKDAISCYKDIEKVKLYYELHQKMRKKKKEG